MLNTSTTFTTIFSSRQSTILHCRFEVAARAPAKNTGDTDERDDRPLNGSLRIRNFLADMCGFIKTACTSVDGFQSVVYDGTDAEWTHAPDHRNQIETGPPFDRENDKFELCGNVLTSDCQLY